MSFDGDFEEFSASAKHSPRVWLILTACIGIIVSIVAAAAVIRANDEIAQLAFAKEAAESLQTIQAQVANAHDALYSLRDLLDATDPPVRREEFQAFAKRLRERFVGLRDTGWAPRVTRTDRDAFERNVSTAGFPEYVIRERDKDGKLGRAVDRETYFPILYPDPVEMTPKVMGLNLSFEVNRRKALLHSIKTRQPASTPPLALIVGNGETNGFMSFLPVFGPGGTANAPRGVVYGAFEIKPMIEKILKLALRANDISLYFYDLSKPVDDQLIYAHFASDRGSGSSMLSRQEILTLAHWEGPLNMANQTWSVVFVPANKIGHGIWQWPAFLSLCIGLIVTGMVEAYLVISMRRTAQLERLTDRLRTTAKTLGEKGEKLAHLARHDPLTGLPNRAAFAEDTLSISARGSEKIPIAVLMLDLDRFKAVNDTLGHAAGDRLLCKVADRLRANLRQGDVIARLGGDEFAIVQAHILQPEAAESLARRLVDVLCQPYNIVGQKVEIGVSIGIAVATIVGADIDTMLREADRALYTAKLDGRGTWRFANAA